MTNFYNFALKIETRSAKKVVKTILEAWNDNDEDLILLHFYLQMLNDVNVNKSWDSLRCKYQLKQIIKTGEKKYCNQWKLHSEKNELKISKPYLQRFM